MKLETYQAIRRVITDEYGALVEERILSKEDASHRVESLQKERFIVSVCGQIKAGKSTLLNALLFGEEVLPSDDTPETAKLTTIEWAERPCFEAVFYSPEEWANVRASYPDKSKDGEKFAEECECAARKGVFPQKVLGQVKRSNDLSLLKEYVSVVEKDSGVYTPFVKNVNLFHPAPLLRDITVVDTPGINDPNIIREKVTKDWVNKSHAVVYCISATQPFDSVDYDFIERYLAGVRRTNLLYAVNKVDDVSSEAELDAWLQEISASDEFRANGLLEDRASIQKVCGLAGLLQSIAARSNRVADRYKAYYAGYKKSDYLTEKNGVMALSELIQNRIIKNKGNDILRTEVTFLEGIGKREARDLESQAKQCEITMSLCGKGKAELIARRDECHAQDKQARAALEAASTELRHIIANLKGVLRARASDAAKNAARELEAGFHSCVTFNQIRARAREHLNVCLAVAQSAMHTEAKQAMSAMANELQKVMNNVKAVYRDTFALQQGVYDEAFDALEAISDILGGVKRGAADFPDADVVIRENTGWFGRTFKTSRALQDARAGMSSELADMARDKLKRAAERYGDAIEKGVNGMKERLAIKTDARAREMHEKIKILIEQETDSDKHRAQLERKKTGLEKRLRKIGQRSASFATNLRHAGYSDE